MTQKRAIFHFFLFVLLFLSLTLKLSYALILKAEGTNFNILINEGSAIGFQTQSKYVILTPTSGDLNSSTNLLRMYGYSGVFQFLSNENLTLEINYTVSTVKIKENDKYILIPSGNSLNIINNETVTLTWDITIESWLPLMFCFGMIGLFSVVGGSMWTVKQLKKKKYYHGLINGLIFVTVGVALVLAWLWG